MGIAEEAAKSIILIDSGMAYTRSDAAIRIATYLRWPWSTARHLKILPRGLRNWLYDTIAANRYRFFGKSDSCIIPDKSIKDRFTGL
jgi:predicted DCC family thiol-disulfide oxidoreductase YuxK